MSVYSPAVIKATLTLCRLESFPVLPSDASPLFPRSPPQMWPSWLRSITVYIYSQGSLTSPARWLVLWMEAESGKSPPPEERRSRGHPTAHLQIPGCFFWDDNPHPLLSASCISSQPACFSSSAQSHPPPPSIQPPGALILLWWCHPYGRRVVAVM